MLERKGAHVIAPFIRFFLCGLEARAAKGTEISWLYGCGTVDEIIFQLVALITILPEPIGKVLKHQPVQLLMSPQKRAGIELFAGGRAETGD